MSTPHISALRAGFLEEPPTIAAPAQVSAHNPFPRVIRHRLSDVEPQAAGGAHE